MTVVVARYNENLDWLKELRYNYVVYNKGSDDLPDWIKNVTKLPNIGREAHTYLTYMADQYENLPDYVAFVQGDPFVHAEKIIDLLNDYERDSDFYPIADRMPVFHKKGNNRNLGRFATKVLKSVVLLFGEELDNFTCPAGAQFVVSRKAIVSHKRETYKKMIVLMDEGQSHGLRCLSRRHKENCNCTCLFSPWVFETIWKIFFERKTVYD